MQLFIRSTPYAVRLGNPGKFLYPPPLTLIRPEQFRELLSVSHPNSQRAQLYLHLPFCESICTFCPIHKSKLTANSPVVEYVEALKTELKALSELPFVRELRFESVYFGGGTPSIISNPHLEALVETIQKYFKLSSPQITFEGHIHSLSREKFQVARSLGFNRISTGIQTFDPELRQTLNLIPTEAEIRRCVDIAREEGFDDFNIDLMYNLPGQTLRVWEMDLLKAVSLEPTGMDIYETIVAHPTRMSTQIARGELRINSDPANLADNYLLAEEVLSSYNYVQKNLFVWDRFGYENRMVGLQRQLRDAELNVIGAGLSAYSLINGQPFINHFHLRSYTESVRQTRHGLKAYRQTSLEEKMERFMIMSLEEFYFDKNRFAETFQCSMDHVFEPQLFSFQKRGLIQAVEGGYRLTLTGRAWAATMAIEFFNQSVLEEILKSFLKNGFFGGMTHEDKYEIPLFAIFHPETILKDWKNFQLLVEYFQFMWKTNRRWPRTFARKLIDTTCRAWFPYGLLLYAAELSKHYFKNHYLARYKHGKNWDPG